MDNKGLDVWTLGNDGGVSKGRMLLRGDMID